MSTCSCGQIFNEIPITARLGGDAELYGWYWECACGSTLFKSATRMDRFNHISRQHEIYRPMANRLSKVDLDFITDTLKSTAHLNNDDFSLHVTRLFIYARRVKHENIICDLLLASRV